MDVEVAAHVLEVRDDRWQEEAAPAVDAARPMDPPRVRAWPPAKAVREGPRSLHGPIIGTQEHLWKRFLKKF